MADLEQEKLYIAKSIYIERIVRANNSEQIYSENEITRKAISDAKVFLQEWSNATKPHVVCGMTKTSIF